MATNPEEKIKQSPETSTLKDLSPNVAGLLCYVAAWISGIVFLVLEQKNHFVRFHALQSIIVFGTLSIASAILGYIPFAGVAFSAIIGVTGFILWIILMVKAYSGETFKLPWAGDLAEKLTDRSMPPTGSAQATPDVPAGMVRSEAAGPGAAISISASPADSSVLSARPNARESRRTAFRQRYYSTGARSGRIARSAVAIAFSLALIIFLNFFNQYIAYYEGSYFGGVTYWQAYPLLSPQFYTWLPLVTVVLAFTVIGHAVLIAFDKFLLREIVEIFLTVFALTAVVSLLAIFPFDFGLVPNQEAAHWFSVGLTIALIFVAVGLGIGSLVRFIQLIVHAAEGRY